MRMRSLLCRRIWILIALAASIRMSMADDVRQRTYSNCSPAVAGVGGSFTLNCKSEESRISIPAYRTSFRGYDPLSPGHDPLSLGLDPLSRGHDPLLSRLGKLFKLIDLSLFLKSTQTHIVFLD